MSCRLRLHTVQTWCNELEAFASTRKQAKRKLLSRSLSCKNLNLALYQFWPRILSPQSIQSLQILSMSRWSMSRTLSRNLFPTNALPTSPEWLKSKWKASIGKLSLSTTTHLSCNCYPCYRVQKETQLQSLMPDTWSLLIITARSARTSVLIPASCPWGIHSTPWLRLWEIQAVLKCKEKNLPFQNTCISIQTHLVESSTCKVQIRWEMQVLESRNPNGICHGENCLSDRQETTHRELQRRSYKRSTLCK